MYSNTHYSKQISTKTAVIEYVKINQLNNEFVSNLFNIMELDSTAFENVFIQIPTYSFILNVILHIHVLLKPRRNL